MFTDKVLVCKECGKEFVFTAGEQEFYAEKGFQNEPQRCRECRAARKNAAPRPEKEMFDAVCAECGKPARCRSVPVRTVRSTAASASPAARRLSSGNPLL